MFVSHKNERLCHAVVFFLENTNYCYGMKLLKLLNFLDFESYRQTGYGVTHLRYEAWRMGPVAPSLYDDLNTIADGGTDGNSAGMLSDFISVKKQKTDGRTSYRIRAKRGFDAKWFSQRELTIMKRLAHLFRDARANDIVAFSHEHHLPWHRVYRGGEHRAIPYELVFECEPIIKDMPSMSLEEYHHTREIFSGIDSMMERA